MRKLLEIRKNARKPRIHPLRHTQCEEELLLAAASIFFSVFWPNPTRCKIRRLLCRSPTGTRCQSFGVRRAEQNQSSSVSRSARGVEVRQPPAPSRQSPTALRQAPQKPMGIPGCTLKISSATRKHKCLLGGVRPVVSHESEEPRGSNTPGYFSWKTLTAPTAVPPHR